MEKSQPHRSVVALAAVAVALVIPAAASASPMDFGGADDSLSTVVYSTFEHMVPADVDDRLDVYARAGGNTFLMSTGPTGGNGAFSVTLNGISADGSRVVFSTAERLTADDTDDRMDVYYRENGLLVRASGDAQSPGNGNFDARFRRLDRATGRIAFETNEPLTAGDTDTAQDVYVRGTALARASVPPTTGGQGGDGAFDATFAGFGGGGRVFFHTNEALSTADTDAAQDVYMWEEGAGPEQFVSDSDTADDPVPATFVGVGDSGDLPVWSTFEQAVDAEDNDANDDLYSRDLSAGVTKNESAAFTTADVTIDRVALTSDRIFAHTTEQKDGDADTFNDVFQLRDGVATRISLSNGAEDSFFGGTSDDGTHVAWMTAEQVLPADTDTATDVYETVAGSVSLVSAGPVGNLAAGFRAYAADGSRIVFTAGGNFGSDQDGADDLFARAGGVTTPLTAGTGSSFIAFNAASANATGIVYTTLDSVLPQDGDGEADIYKNLNGVTTLESYELVAPITTITSGPTGLTKLNPPPFGWTASEANVEFNCRYDGAQFGACGSLAKLSQGPHTFQVRATDRAGNVGPAASRSFTVDSVAPAVTIKPAPRPAFNGVFKITVTCPKSAAGRCRGRLVITSGKRIKVGKTRRVVTFASKSFSIKAGARTTLKLRVSKRNLAILKRLRSVRAVMTATVTDGLGNKRTTRKTLTLRAPKANR